MGEYYAWFLGALLPGGGEVVVWYYDVAMAAEVELTEVELGPACKEGFDLVPPRVPMRQGSGDMD